MPDDERIEQLELEVKVLLSNNKGLKDKIEELKRENQIIYEGMKHKINMEWVLKIKAKIEVLEKQDKESKLSHNYLVIPVLQSLLGKE